MDVVAFAIKNPVKVAVGVILILLFGLLSVLGVSIQLTPDVDRPVIVVHTTWSGASPQEMEREIVDRQEEKLKNVSNLEKMTSSCSEGQAEIKLEFPVSVDKDTAFRDVSDKLRQVTGYPDEVEHPTISATDARMENIIAWMILYAEAGQDVVLLKSFIEDNVKPILERAEGIAEVNVYGGREREIQIVIDPQRLAAHALTLRDVERALRRQNENISAGTIEQGKRDYTYRTLGEYRTVGDIRSTVVAYAAGGPIKVGDVAEVVDGFKKASGFVRSKGRSVLALPARRMTGANVIQAMRNLKRQTEKVNREILAPRGLGLELTQVYDETTYIWSAIRLVVTNMFFGGALAIAVLIVFLRSGSATGIIAVAIPISVVGTFVVIALLGRSLNVVMLAGMAFAVGMVVDNAIVVLENIYRHRSMGKSRGAAALDGAREVWGAVLASTLTTMAVFLPVITVREEAGQLFKDIAIAISSAVGFSLVVSVLVIPPLAARFFRATRATGRGRSSAATGGTGGAAGIGGTGDTGSAGARTWRFGAWASGVVSRLNAGVGVRVAVVVGLSGAAVVGSWVLAPATEYLPAGNRNLIFGLLFSPPGYSVAEFEHMAAIVEDGDPSDATDGIRPLWEADASTAALLRPVSIPLGAGGREVRTVVPPPIENFFFVAFDGGAFMGCTSRDPDNVKPLEFVMARAGARIPGVFGVFRQSSLFNTGGRRGGNSIDLEIRGLDLDAVVAAGMATRRRLREIGYHRVEATPANFDLGRPEIQLTPDRARAADLGLDVRDVGFVVRACVDGAFVGEFNDRGDKIDMVLKVAGTAGSSLTEIGQIPVYTPSGHIVPLASAVVFRRTTAPQQITHIEEMSAVTLSVRPQLGVPLQTTMRVLETQVIGPLRASGALPPSIITTLAGTADKLTQTQRALAGDFRGVVARPRLLGLGVASSVGVLGVLGLIGVAAVGLVLGPRAAVKAGMAGGVVGVLVFLAVNPSLAVTVF
ncbi:MAG: efflux RND transporter permease subunit, partial [Phycisphaerae bacterium]